MYNLRGFFWRNSSWGVADTKRKQTQGNPRIRHDKGFLGPREAFLVHLNTKRSIFGSIKLPLKSTPMGLQSFRKISISTDQRKSTDATRTGENSRTQSEQGKFIDPKRTGEIHGPKTNWENPQTQNELGKFTDPKPKGKIHGPKTNWKNPRTQNQKGKFTDTKRTGKIHGPKTNRENSRTQNVLGKSTDPKRTEEIHRPKTYWGNPRIQNELGKFTDPKQTGKIRAPKTNWKNPRTLRGKGSLKPGETFLVWWTTLLKSTSTDFKSFRKFLNSTDPWKSTDQEKHFWSYEPPP